MTVKLTLVIEDFTALGQISMVAATTVLQAMGAQRLYYLPRSFPHKQKALASQLLLILNSGCSEPLTTGTRPVSLLIV